MLTLFNATHNLAANYSYTSRLLWGGGTLQGLVEPTEPIPKTCLTNAISFGDPSSYLFNDTDAPWTLGELMKFLPDIAQQALDLAASRPHLVSTLDDIEQLQESGDLRPVTADERKLMQTRMDLVTDQLLDYMSDAVKNGNFSNASVIISYPYLETHIGAFMSFPTLSGEFGGIHDWILLPNVTAGPFDDMVEYIAIATHMSGEWPEQMKQTEQLLWILIGAAAGEVTFEQCLPQRRRLAELVQPAYSARLVMPGQQALGRVPARMLLAPTGCLEDIIDLHHAFLDTVCDGLSAAFLVAAAVEGGPAALVLVGGYAANAAFTIYKRAHPEIASFSGYRGHSLTTLQKAIQLGLGALSALAPSAGGIANTLNPARWANLACSVVSAALEVLEAFNEEKLCAAGYCSADPICQSAASDCIRGWAPYLYLM